MTWAGRRKLTYFSLLVAVMLVLSVSVVRHYTVKPATCFDTRKNADETGVDCGGGCLSYCPDELAQPKVRWVRTFQIAAGVYTVVAYIEHNNANAAVPSAPYEFKLYDENNTLIATRTGSTYLGPAGQSAIAETLIQTGNATPAIARFAFTAPLIWQKVGPQFSRLVINTDQYAFDPTADKSTRLTVNLRNENRASFSDMDVVAILYDDNNNAITAVKNFIPTLSALRTQPTYFTWPFTLAQSVARVEVIPRINPYTTTLQ